MATVSCAAATVWSAMLWMFMSWPLTENVCSSLAWCNCGNLISLVNDWFENEHKTLILGNEESEVWWGFWERFLGLYRKYRREDKEASSSFVVATPGWEGWYPVSHLVSIKPQAWRWERLRTMESWQELVSSPYGYWTFKWSPGPILPLCFMSYLTTYLFNIWVNFFRVKFLFFGAKNLLKRTPSCTIPYAWCWEYSNSKIRSNITPIFSLVY